MTAAQTKERERKHTGIRKEKIRKVESKAQKQENRTQGVHSNKASRLCCKVKPGISSHYLPSSSCSRWRRYQVSRCHYDNTAAVEPHLRFQMNENQTKLPVVFLHLVSPVQYFQ